MDAKNLEIDCPSCHSKLVIDPVTGMVIWHEIKKIEKNIPTMEEMIKNLNLQKKTIEEKIQNESKSLKDRSRRLEEKFKESMKRLDESGEDKATPPIRPIDLD